MYFKLKSIEIIFFLILYFNNFDFLKKKNKISIAKIFSYFKLNLLKFIFV
jgi:hypothetical protein